MSWNLEVLNLDSYLSSVTFVSFHLQFETMIVGVCGVNNNILGRCFLGKGPGTKSDEFSGNSKQPSNLTPSFSENYVANFFMTDMVEYIQGGMMAR